MYFRIKKMILIFMVLIIFILSALIINYHGYKKDTNKQITELKEEIVELKRQIIELQERPICECPEEIEENDKNEEEPKEITEANISLGKFKLTAYCSCSKCCGKWSLNRPKDKNGNEIVYGSTGERLIAGTSIAVDPKVIPYGSKVVINGHIYIAHDTGGAIKGNRIDVYHDNHQEAKNFGVQYAEVHIVND